MKSLTQRIEQVLAQFPLDASRITGVSERAIDAGKLCVRFNLFRDELSETSARMCFVTDLLTVRNLDKSVKFASVRELHAATLRALESKLSAVHGARSLVAL